MQESVGDSRRTAVEAAAWRLKATSTTEDFRDFTVVALTSLWRRRRHYGVADVHGQTAAQTAGGGRQLMPRCMGTMAQARIQGGGAGAGAHPWDGRTRAEGAGFLVSRAERRDTGVS